MKPRFSRSSLSAPPGSSHLWRPRRACDHWSGEGAGQPPDVALLGKLKPWVYSVGVAETSDIDEHQRTILYWALGAVLDLVVPSELGLLRRPRTLGF